jgi:hypothetical protein
MSMKSGALLGAAVGSGIAVVMIALDNMNLGRISVPLADFIDRAIFRVCPPYIVGFWNIIPNKAVWFIVAILGNAVLYALLFALIAGAISLFRKSAA